MKMTLKEGLYTLMSKANLKEILYFRNKIDNFLFLFLNLIYIIAFCFFPPVNISGFGIMLGLIMAPLMTAVCYIRTITFLYVYNWFHILTSLITYSAFIFTLLCLQNHYQFVYGTPLVHEISQCVVVSVIGFLSAVIISLPMKIVHYFLFEPTKFYYNYRIWEAIENHLYPKKAEEAKKRENERQVERKESFKYDLMNETQLQIELNQAIEEERFEDAEKIKEVLTTKFR